MQIDKLLRDVTQAEPSASLRSQHIALTEMLNAKHGAGCITLKGVAKWSERGSMPMEWALRVAALPDPPLNLNDYA